MNIKFQNFETCSTHVKQQIENTVNNILQLMKSNLVGLYLHGSIVLDAFDENSSDLDIVGVINHDLTLDEKIQLGSLLLSLNKKPCCLDIQFFIKTDINPLKHRPTEHFYFADYWALQYEKISRSAENAAEILASVFSDGEAISDFAVIKQSGICLFGKPINEIFPNISNELFLGAVSRGIDDFYVESDNDSQSAFLVLQLCRILSFKEINKILSKQAAAEWALANLPSKHQSIIKRAIYNKFGLGSELHYSKEDAISFKSYMLQKIK